MRRERQQAHLLADRLGQQKEDVVIFRQSRRHDAVTLVAAQFALFHRLIAVKQDSGGGRVHLPHVAQTFQFNQWMAFSFQIRVRKNVLAIPLIRQHPFTNSIVYMK